MNTKEAIEFTRSFKDIVTSIDMENDDEKAIEQYNNKIDNVIELLKRGEKFEAMWEEFSKKYGNYYYAYDVRGDVCRKHEYIETFLNKLEQKYFPKPKEEVIKWIN